jgi:hypothetical protein
MRSLLQSAAYYRRHRHSALANLWHNSAMPRHHHRAAPTTLEEHLRRMRRVFPDIRAFAEEDDGFCWDEGREALEASQLQRAEKIFKKLAIAPPEQFDGYYGLAQVHRCQHLLHRPCSLST